MTMLKQDVQECLPAPAEPTHIHWLFWAYASKVGDDYHDIVQLDVLASDHLEALGKVQRLYSLPVNPLDTQPRGGYLLRSVVEHYDSQCKRA